MRVVMRWTVGIRREKMGSMMWHGMAWHGDKGREPRSGLGLEDVYHYHSIMYHV
jgi:hypothetical protein